jgi:hypothetical protein
MGFLSTVAIFFVYPFTNNLQMIVHPTVDALIHILITFTLAIVIATVGVTLTRFTI